MVYDTESYALQHVLQITANINTFIIGCFLIYLTIYSYFTNTYITNHYKY